MKTILLLLVLFISTYSQAQNPIDEKKMYVRSVYLVSKDKLPNPEFTGAINSTLKNIQNWYRLQLDGYTFNLHPEGVRVIKADVDSTYFSTTPNGNDKDAWGILNCEKISKRIFGGRFLDPNSIWVVYSDSTDWGGQGGSGFTCMPGGDLLGLIGKNHTNLNIERWIGGAAHEIGHAFGLTHPTNNVQTNKALMAFGWHSDYPENTFLSKEEKDQLAKSPFFYKDGVSILGKVLEKLYVPEGWFELRENGHWYEFKYNNSISFVFSKVSENSNAFR